MSEDIHNPFSHIADPSPSRDGADQPEPLVTPETLAAERIRQGRPRAEINRDNAKKSTGPRTAAGKARSRQNALKHGGTAAMCHTRQERNELHLYTRDLMARFQPECPLEADLLSRLAMARQRYWRTQAELSATERAVTQHLKSRRPIEAKLAMVANDTPDKLKPVDRLHRYLQEADRAFQKTLTHLGNAARRNQQQDRENERWAIEKEKREKASKPDLYSSAEHSVSRYAQERQGIDPSMYRGFLDECLHRFRVREKAITEREKQLGIVPDPPPPVADQGPTITHDGNKTILHSSTRNEPRKIPQDHPLRRNPLLDEPAKPADPPPQK